MELVSKIESLLFISIKPLSIKFLAEKTGGNKKDIEDALVKLGEKYNIEGSGVSLLRIDDKAQLTTASEHAALITDFLKEETTGDLTPASLETLTVIAYRGPITKTELELIRGVNCTLILRNLLMRGFIEEHKDKNELLSLYQVTFDFLKYLGITSSSQLPEYDKLHSHELIQALINPSAVQDAGSQVVADTSELNKLANEQISNIANEEGGENADLETTPEVVEDVEEDEDEYDDEDDEDEEEEEEEENN